MTAEELLGALVELASRRRKLGRNSLNYAYSKRWLIVWQTDVGSSCMISYSCDEIGLTVWHNSLGESSAVGIWNPSGHDQLLIRAGDILFTLDEGLDRLIALSATKIYPNPET